MLTLLLQQTSVKFCFYSCKNLNGCHLGYDTVYICQFLPWFGRQYGGDVFLTYVVNCQQNNMVSQSRWVQSWFAKYWRYQLLENAVNWFRIVCHKIMTSGRVYCFERIQLSWKNNGSGYLFFHKFSALSLDPFLSNLLPWLYKAHEADKLSLNLQRNNNNLTISITYDFSIGTCRNAEICFWHICLVSKNVITVEI